MKTSIRQCSVPSLPSSGEGVETAQGEEISGRESLELQTPRPRKSPRQLKTFDETSLMTPDPSIHKYTGDERTKLTLRPLNPLKNLSPSITETNLVTETDPIISQNVFQRRSKKGKKVDRINVDQLLETKQTSLDITEIRSRRIESSADIDEYNIIEGKQTRRPNPKYANAVSTEI